MIEYLWILIYTLVALGVGLSFLLIPKVLSPKGYSRQKLEPYECGVELLSKERKKFHVKFYLVATLFILFDIEVVFLIPWAVLFQEMSSIAVIEMLLFLGVLSLGLVYMLRKKALEWE